ncbi:Uncharacterised protein [Klebsiella pneumoniae subsp. pneumoniae]|nr:Uncharacterised protein [Klebsiella pneumoniae subsp. pneumoniae]
MQQVVAERRFAAFFTPLFSLRIVEGGVLAGRSLAVLIAIANDGWADKQHQVAFRHFLAVGAEQGADHRDIPEQRHFVSGIGDGFIQQPANHHRFAAADQHGVIHRPGIEGRPRSLLVLEAESATLDTSCSISSSTASPSLICGFTFSLMPTVLRSDGIEDVVA